MVENEIVFYEKILFYENQKYSKNSFFFPKFNRIVALFSEKAVKILNFFLNFLLPIGFLSFHLDTAVVDFRPVTMADIRGDTICSNGECPKNEGK